MTPKKPQILYSPMLASFGGGSARGFNPGGGDLYAFSSFTFTNAGQTGRTGPSLAQCQSAYSGEAFLSGFFTMTTTGYQKWTVPRTGDYTFIVKGAESGASTNQGSVTGKGAILSGFVISLNESDVLTLVVGQTGPTVTFSGGGGGGSFVVNGSTLLLAAGGGGGGGVYNPDQNGQNASSTLSVTNSTSSQGGSAGANNGGSGGAGFSGDGSNSYSNGGGHDFSNGFEGGVGSGTSRANGGFGGGGAGGAGTAANAGGGGGGYRGGDGQQGASPWSNGDASTNARDTNVTAGTVSTNNSGHGSISITAPT